MGADDIYQFISYALALMPLYYAYIIFHIDYSRLWRIFARFTAKAEGIKTASGKRQSLGHLL